MTITPQEFYRATNPTKAIDPHDPKMAGYYIDFSAVRGGQIIEELRTAIAWSEPEEYRCELFTGHIGCGKSTELLRLKDRLEEDGFHVVYFVSDEDLDMGDAELTEILLAIAKQVSASLEKDQTIQNKIAEILQNAKKLLLSEVLKFDVETGEIPGIGKFGVGWDSTDAENTEIKFSTCLGGISTTVRKNRDLRDNLRHFLEPKSENVIDVLNQGLFKPAGKKLRQENKAGLVVLVDNLDRLHSRRVHDSNKFQSEYLFGDRGDEFTKLECHVVYTMPLALRYSDSYQLVKERFKVRPNILPMVPTYQRDGSIHENGLKALKQMILSRAYPQYSPEKRVTKIPELFQSEQVLEKLCHISGGHVRNVIRLLQEWIKVEKTLPLRLATLEEIIIRERNDIRQNIDQREWNLLKRIHHNHEELGGLEDYEKLISNLPVYEYIDEQGSWYDVHPVLWEMLLAEQKDKEETIPTTVNSRIILEKLKQKISANGNSYRYVLLEGSSRQAQQDFYIQLNAIKLEKSTWHVKNDQLNFGERDAYILHPMHSAASIHQFKNLSKLIYEVFQKE